MSSESHSPNGLQEEHGDSRTPLYWPMVAGVLYLVATPIGNLEDISFRAVRILREEVDLVACEDTRHSRKLLGHYGIHKPTVSYHEHNEAERAAELLERLDRGERIALMTDAGTPLVSDPGYRIVKLAVDNGIPVVPLPGASAVTAALMASGLPTDSFYFGGFLPAKPSQRRKTLEKLRDVEATLAFFEAPHRILEALEDVEAALGPRSVVLARELTKIHEEFLRGTPADILSQLRSRPGVKGEFTILIAKPAAGAAPPASSIPEAVQALMAGGLARMDAIKEVARERGLPKREVYRQMEEAG